MSQQPPSASAPVLDDTPPSARARYLPMQAPPVEAPDLVPARMLNELVYCERLMYLEWVQGEFADNVFTVDGRAVHRRADKPGRPLRRGRSRKGAGKASEDTAEPEAGAEPAAEDGSRDEGGKDLPYQSRAVWLSSATLGITAKIDVIDVEGDRVVPIEYKRGKRPDLAEGAHLPERVQLCAQVLLLREHGFQCDEAAIYFAQDHQRVPIAITPELIARTRSAVLRAKEVAAGPLPAPPEGSPKCNGCSLVGICLPDEVSLLQSVHGKEAPEARIEDEPWYHPDLYEPLDPDPAGLGIPGKGLPVRQLHPARDDRLPVMIQEQGAQVRLSGERLIIQRPHEAAVEARLANTSQVCVFGNVQITSQALRTLMDRAIPVSFFSYGGFYVGRAFGHDSKNVGLRLAQYRAVTSPELCLRMARGLVVSKILNCRTLLRRNSRGGADVALGELKQLARKAEEMESLGSLLGIEGTAARAYFGAFTTMLKEEDGVREAFDLDGRNRRPPKDPVNALLSFCYSLLTKEFAIVLGAVGLDAMLGFYHQPHFGRPALALDLMEEFRPLVADSVVVAAINNGTIQGDDFVYAAGGVALKAGARKKLILAFERRMDQLVAHPVFGYRISYRRVLEVQCRLLSRTLLGELESYPAFRTR
ncbi:MAG: CRISPR-associated endonuclease Cas1 [Polyangiaceae bacterium]|nr:CRISPR-associated endonuclease Cas1 [Polyangiaceae bacterium]